MNLAELEKKLMAAVRRNPPCDTVPFAFEKRIMTLVTARTVVDYWAVWSRALWRGAMGCVALVILLGAFSFFVPASGPAGDLSQEFENAMLASADQPDTDSAW